MDGKEYIETMLEEHLLDGPTYQQINEQEDLRIQCRFREAVKGTLHDYADDLIPEEMEFFERGLKENGLRKHDRMPYIYGTPKVHKPRTKHTNRVRMRPVTSQCGSFFSIVSRFVDRKLQKLVKLVPSYIQNSKAVIQILQHLQLPQGSKLFTSDTTSM